MALVLHTAPSTDAGLAYLTEALKRLPQNEIAQRLRVTDRTVRDWKARQAVPKKYLNDLQQLLLPLARPDSDSAPFTFIDLFAGIGGIRRAFEDIGGRCVFTSEWDSYAQKTYAENFPDGHPIAGDITQVAAADIPDHDLLLGGFPCQPFSIAGVSKKNALGRAHGFACDTQGTLFFDIARIIDAKRPKAFLLENVKNLLSHDKGRTFEVIRRTLVEELGYHVQWRVIDAAHFVPQHRERILIVGFREPAAFDFDALPLPAKGRFKLGDILHRTDGSEPRIPSDRKRFFDHESQHVDPKYSLADTFWRYLRGKGIAVVDPRDLTQALNRRYAKDASEILIEQGKGMNPRRLTPRECARLMGFPDNFQLPVSDTQAYLQLAQAAIPPMLEPVAKLMASSLSRKESATIATAIDVPKDIMSTGRWTKEQLKLAFHLYCQLPFGRLHSRNPEIIDLATLIGRTPSAVAMKLVNFASLDPAITDTGRSGLGNASAMDREVWEEFHADWEGLATACAVLDQQLRSQRGLKPVEILDAEDLNRLADFVGETRQVIATQRIKQHFFRRAVLSSYRGRCCMSGVSDSRLLVASHIVPWSEDKANRLNPRNGLCLSAIHDKAFDRGLITLSDELRVNVSPVLLKSANSFCEKVFVPLQGRQIELPERFQPNLEFVSKHRSKWSDA